MLQLKHRTGIREEKLASYRSATDLLRDTGHDTASQGNTSSFLYVGCQLFRTASNFKGVYRPQS